MFSFLFDSNSVRDFARRIKSEEEWERLRAAWKKADYKSAWIPWTVGEVTGTNLMKKPLTVEFCEETALAVRRFDRIAGCDILPSPEELIRWSMEAFVGGDQTLPQGDVLQRASIQAAKQLKYPEQVWVTKQPDDVYVVEIQDYKLGLRAGQRLPHTFADHTAERAEKWKARLDKAGRLREDLTHEEILQAIVEHVVPTVVGLGRNVGVPDDVLKKFETKTIEQIVVTPFMYGAVAQDWYCIQRALGRKTGRIAETLGRDLVITFYIPMAWKFVVSDTEFAKLIGKVLPAGALITFEEFREALLTGRDLMPPPEELPNTPVAV